MKEHGVDKDIKNKCGISFAGTVMNPAHLAQSARGGDWVVLLVRSGCVMIQWAEEAYAVREGYVLLCRGQELDWVPSEAFDAQLLVLKAGEVMGVDMLPYPKGLYLAKQDDCVRSAFQFYFDYIIALSAEREEARQVDIMADNLKILLKLIERHQVVTDDVTDPMQSIESKISQVKGFIDAHYSEEISLQRLASEFFISPDYLSHAFKRYVGHSTIRYLILVRMGHAKKLLLTTDLSVQQIALRVGYDNSNYFSLLFKKVTGFSPTTFALESNRDI